jgi:hypothetical protein
VFRARFAVITDAGDSLSGCPILVADQSPVRHPAFMLIQRGAAGQCQQTGKQEKRQGSREAAVCQHGHDYPVVICKDSYPMGIGRSCTELSLRNHPTGPEADYKSTGSRGYNRNFAYL